MVFAQNVVQKLFYFSDRICMAFISGPPSESISGPPSEHLLLPVFITISTCYQSHLPYSPCCCPFGLFPLFFLSSKRMKRTKTGFSKQENIFPSARQSSVSGYDLWLFWAAFIVPGLAEISYFFTWMAFWRRPRWIPAILKGRDFCKSGCRVTNALCGFSIYLWSTRHWQILPYK